MPAAANQPSFRGMDAEIPASLTGYLLVAAPSLVEPNFHRTVVLVGDHGEEGAMGVVLNRPSGVTVAEAVEPLTELVGGDELVYVGGPVQQEAIVVLGEFEQPERAASLVLGAVGSCRARSRRARMSDRSPGSVSSPGTGLGAGPAPERAGRIILDRRARGPRRRLHRRPRGVVERRAAPQRRALRRPVVDATRSQLELIATRRVAPSSLVGAGLCPALGLRRPLDFGVTVSCNREAVGHCGDMPT